LHFLASSALTADALSVIGPPMAKASRTQALANPSFLDIFPDTPKEAPADVHRSTTRQRIEDEKVLNHRRQFGRTPACDRGVDHDVIEVSGAVTAKLSFRDRPPEFAK
jgi:hypothetical protein